jgi:hypothetical protein
MFIKSILDTHVLQDWADNLVTVLIAKVKHDRTATADQKHHHDNDDNQRGIALLLGFFQGSAEFLTHFLLLFNVFVE